MLAACSMILPPPLVLNAFPQASSAFSRVITLLNLSGGSRERQSSTRALQKSIGSRKEERFHMPVARVRPGTLNDGGWLQVKSSARVRTTTDNGSSYAQRGLGRDAPSRYWRQRMPRSEISNLDVMKPVPLVATTYCRLATVAH